MEPDQAEPLICGGGPGSVGWAGAFGGWWRADRTNDSVLIFLSHNMIDRDQFANGIGFGVYDAIARFERLASELTSPA
jgi:CubicO group peptidase (beta-lactamase class C family)